MNEATPSSSPAARRYDWLDAMKLISAFFVYTVHYEGMGRYGLLFLALLVPCFFFCSGYTAHRHENDALLPFVKAKAKRILWPYLVFGLCSLALRVLLFEMPLGDIIAWGKRFAFGSRASVPVAALWFLPCLFFMSVLYHVLRKLLRHRALLLVVCFAASAAVKLLHEAPTLPWGIDMAVRFQIYYALGDAAHAMSERKPLASYSLVGKGVLAAITLLNFYLLYAHFYFGRGYFFSLLGISEPSYFLQSAEQFVFAVTGTWCVAVLAMALAPLPGVCKAGRYTLIYCGVEQIVKTLVPMLLAAFGLTVSNAGGAVMLLQAAAMLAIAYRFFALPITKHLPWMVGARPQAPPEALPLDSASL